jgi:flagellar hook-basal body complex protein FliE
MIDPVTLLAQTNPLDDQEKNIIPKVGKIEAPPFVKFLDMAVNALQEVSKAETQTNDLIVKYTQGKANVEEVMVATAKMNIMVQLAVTATTTAVTTFKEIQQMPV